MIHPYPFNSGICLRCVRPVNLKTQKGVSQRTMAKHEETIMTYAKDGWEEY